MKFLDLFGPITKGNFGLTEEAVYRSIQLGNRMIPLWGGNQEHIHADRFVDEKGRTKYDEPITIFDAEGIIISLDGSSGNMTYKQNERFALNHHAGFFQVNRPDLIDPRFFSIFYQQQLRAESISEGSKTLTLDSIYGLDFDVPTRTLQEKLMTEISPILKRKNKINELISRISLLKRKSLSVDYKNYQARGVPVGDVFNCMNGNTGLTEKEVYQRICDPGNKYRILSSATSDETELGFVPIFHLNGKLIKVFEGKEGILVSRNGKAGSSIFLPAGV
jgi:restriction endonuclease S subunit